jgi:mutator protein MutT
MKPTRRIALALVFDGERWLVARRRAEAHLGGLWEFPGGLCEPGESVAEAALRELREECDVAARAEAVWDTVRCEYADRIVELTPVVCRWVAGTARALASEECRWVTVAELAALPMPAANAALVRAILCRAPHG